jgi:heavy metal sensor kinase
MPTKKLRQLFRTLRFRLASSFVALLTLVLAFVYFAGTKSLQTILENQSQEELREQIGALKGYIRFEDGVPTWFSDRNDPEEDAAVGWIKSVYVIANDKGVPLEGSPDTGLGKLFDQAQILSELQEMQTTHQPIFKYIVGSDKVQYQVLSSTMTDVEHNRKWYVAEGRSLTPDHALLRKFQNKFAFFLPLALGVCMVVSWYSAGAALTALQSVEKVAQEITGSNLGLQIPKRGAEDELDRLIDSFNQMSGRLKQSFEQIRQFSTDVSHELRTPLTAIQGQLEVALFTATRKEQLQEAIENALQDVERLANLVRALLLLSQSESGQIPMNKTQLDVSELLEDLVDQFQIPAEAHNLRLTCLSGGTPVHCEVDRTQIERVITNLLSNAIKYTPEGGWVNASVMPSGTSVKLTVEDSGVGIPESHLPHIFDRFYRVPDPNPEKGLGLGLSFVAAIVRAHGGEINVRSELGRGSRFEVILPGCQQRSTAELAALQDSATQRS